MENYKINGKKISMPTGWHDVTFKDGLKIIEDDLQGLDIFCLFSGISKKDARKLDANKDIYYFLQSFTFLKELPIQDIPQIPKSINYKGEVYLFPHVLLSDEFDFGNTSVGQIEDMKQVITADLSEKSEDENLNNLDLIKIMPKIVAIYIQPILEKEYDYNRAMKLSKELISELSFKEVIYMGNFFLMKLTVLTSGPKKEWQIVRWMKRKLKQAYWNLTRRLDSMQP